MVLSAIRDTRVNPWERWQPYIEDYEQQAPEQSFVPTKGYPQVDSMSSANSLLYAQVMAPYVPPSTFRTADASSELEQEIYLQRVCAHIGPIDLY